MKNDIVSVLIQLIASANQLHSYTVRQLLFAIKEDNSQQPLCQVASWCVGEYGEQLLQSPPEEDEHGPVSYSIVKLNLNTLKFRKITPKLRQFLL